MDGASIKEKYANPNWLDTLMKQLKPTNWEETIMAVNDRSGQILLVTVNL
jgi:hypothetical protein